ncbi:hypothetical protein WJX77_008321 [Trebouxia sp. C0004]
MDEELYVYKLTNRGRHTQVDTVRNGFQLERFQVPADISWEDDKDATTKYYPEVVALLKKPARASRVHIFDHTTRRASEKLHCQEWSSKIASTSPR